MKTNVNITLSGDEETVFKTLHVLQIIQRLSEKNYNREIVIDFNGDDSVNFRVTDEDGILVEGSVYDSLIETGEDINIDIGE